MKLLTPLWLVDDTRKLGEKDDVVKVNNHHWGSDKVNVVNEGTGETYNAPLENLVLISQKEVNEYLEELREYEEWKEETVYQRIMGDTNKEIVVSQQKLNLPAPSITEVTEEDMVDNDDLPFTNDCDSCDVPDKGPVETIEVNIAEYIDLDIYENFILDLVNKVEELQEKEFRKFPIDQDLENLVIHARNALDITYIESIY